MRKSIDLGLHDQDGWPNPKELEHYFLGPQGRFWSSEDRSDSAALWAKGVHGTEHLDVGKGRIDIELLIWRNLDFGVLLIYSKWGGPYKEMFSSKGNLSRLHDLCARSMARFCPSASLYRLKKRGRRSRSSSKRTASFPRALSGLRTATFPHEPFRIRMSTDRSAGVMDHVESAGKAF